MKCHVQATGKTLVSNAVSMHGEYRLAELLVYTVSLHILIGATELATIQLHSKRHFRSMRAISLSESTFFIKLVGRYNHLRSVS